MFLFPGNEATKFKLKLN